MSTERESLFSPSGEDTIRKEIASCETECDLFAGSNTYYWTGAIDALLWILGEGEAPSDSDEDDDD